MGSPSSFDDDELYSSEENFEEEEDDDYDDYDEKDNESLATGTNRLRKRLDRIEEANQKFAEYSQRLQNLAENENSLLEDEDRSLSSFSSFLGEDEVFSPNVEPTRIERPRVHREVKQKSPTPLPSSSPVNTISRRDLNLAKRRAQRSELLLQEAEGKIKLLEAQLAQSRDELSQVKTRLQEKANPEQICRRLLDDAQPIEEHFRTMARNVKTESRVRSRPPFVIGGSSPISLNRKIPVKESSLKSLEEKKRQLNNEYRNVLRYKTQGEDALHLLSEEMRKIESKMQHLTHLT